MREVCAGPCSVYRLELTDLGSCIDLYIFSHGGKNPFRATTVRKAAACASQPQILPTHWASRSHATERYPSAPCGNLLLPYGGAGLVTVAPPVDRDAVEAP